MDKKIEKISKLAIKELYSVFETDPVFDPVRYQIIYYGTKEQFQRAVVFLELNEIDYDADWRHLNGIACPHTVALKVDKVLLKIQK